MINLKKYDNKTVLQLLRFNDSFNNAIAMGKNWIDVLDSLNIVCTKDQIEYIRKYVHSKK